MTNLLEEYRTVTAGAGWRDDSHLGRLMFEGPDATAFLHALLTAEIESIPAGGGTYAAYLTPQGRLITDLTLYRRPAGWLAVVPREIAAALLTRFDSVIFAENVRVADASREIAQFSVVGPRSSRVIAELVGADASALDAMTPFSHQDASGVTVARTDAISLPAFDLFVDHERSREIAERLAASDAVEIDAATAEVLRIEAGRPRFGVDMTTETIPLEAGLLDRAISQTKGCYVGQEIIIRVLHRGGGRVARRLMRIEADEDVPIEAVPAGATLVYDGRDVGHITSAAWSPGRHRVVALGYLHRDALDAREIRIRSATGESSAVVVGSAG